MADTEEVVFEESSGNVFADLGLPNAEERQAKVRLAVAIVQILEDRKLTKAEAAKTLGVAQRMLTALQRFNLEDFTIGDLMQYVSALDYDVVLEFRPKSQPANSGRSMDDHAA